EFLDDLQSFFRFVSRKIQRRQESNHRIACGNGQQISGVQFFYDLHGFELRLKLDSNHQTKPAHFFQDVRMALLTRLELAQKKLADLTRVFVELLALDHLEDFQRHRASERRSAKCARVRSRGKDIREFFANPERANGESA